MRTAIGLFLAWSCCMCGCSSRAIVTDISAVKPGESINGVPFRVKAFHEVEVWRFDEESGQYRRASEQKLETRLLPDQQRLYSIGYQGLPFSDQSMEVDLREDGTLERYKLIDTKKLGTTIEGVASTVDKAVEQKTKRQEALEAASEGAAAKTKDTEDLLIAAVQAKNSAEAAELDLASLPADAPAKAKQAAESAARLAKFQANIAYRRIGRPEPYPGTF